MYQCFAPHCLETGSMVGSKDWTTTQGVSHLGAEAEMVIGSHKLAPIESMLSCAWSTVDSRTSRIIASPLCSRRSWRHSVFLFLRRGYDTPGASDSLSGKKTGMHGQLARTLGADAVFTDSAGLLII